ncbi:MAG: hypothetical protein IJQ82_11755 [Selenomonadaceae bacterium]|nr:hypothetical protein [Selenomonadaceae bacterium]
MRNFAKILGAEADATVEGAIVIDNNGSIQRVDKQAKKETDIAKAHKDKAFVVAYDFRKAKKISSAIAMMKGESFILITSDDLDKHKNLLNCLNGFVDFQDVKFYPYDSIILLTEMHIRL